MSSLKQLRTRIRSVKSTQKITSAMKMVAAARLRRSQERVEAVRPYDRAMYEMVSHLLKKSRQDIAKEPTLLIGHEDLPVHLLIVVTTDRGLCGGFNAAVVREAKSVIRGLQGQGKQVKIFCMGRKGRDLFVMILLILLLKRFCMVIKHQMAKKQRTLKMLWNFH